MKKIAIILFCISLTFPLCAQTSAQADALFRKADWPEACAAYTRLHQKEPSNHVYTYRLARCFGEMGRHEEAVALFEKVSSHKIPLRDYFLAQEYVATYRFSEALETIDAYLAGIRPDNDRYESAQAIREEAETGARWLSKTENVWIVSVQTVPAAHWRDSLRLSKDAGSVSSDGVYLNALGDRRLFADSLGHLYEQSLLMDEWSEPERLPFDGINPFLATDGITVYYSRKNPDGIGGLDLYMTRLNTATHTYLQPALLGMPYSSRGDDVFYALDEAAGEGIFVSAKDDSTMLIYRFVPREERKYMRDAEPAAIRAMAMRQTITPRQQQSATTDTPTKQDDAETATGSPLFSEEETAPAGMLFVVNDSTVYTRMEQFRSEESRALYARYEEVEKLLSQKVRELDRQRRAYAECDTQAEKDCLVPVIMKLEQEVASLRKEQAQLPNQIRLAETAKP